MKSQSPFPLIGTIIIFIGVLTSGCTSSLKFTQPVANSTVRSPVEVCFDVSGYTVEPAKNGVNPGAGHHHILIDVPQPEDMNAPIGKNEGYLHMGDGSTCKKIKLPPGFHTIQAVFADGNHVPVKPPLTSAISIVVSADE
jgi:hypothetical protein